MNNTVYDFLAIGIGPFNLSLACLTQPLEGLSGVFLDKHPTFDWHTGMMLEHAQLQTPFMADLVTLADPTNRYSLLNYMKQMGRIYRFYIREDFFLLRKEYNQYCQWVSAQLGNLCWNTLVDNIHYDAKLQCYRVHSHETNSGKQQNWLTKKLILGTGSTVWIPPCCRSHRQRLIHSSEYLANKLALQQKKAITVIGSGQSAAEIFYDLLMEIDHHHYQLNWITRSARFFPLEYTKLTLEMTSPEWVDYFYALPADKRDELYIQLAPLFKGINSKLINEIYELLYIKQLNTDLHVNLLTHSELTDMHWRENGEFELAFYQQEQQQAYLQHSEAVIMATGYHYQRPLFIEGISGRLRWDDKGRYDVQRNYSIDYYNEIFVQNAESHTHGFASSDLGMACYRNSVLIRELTGREHYPIERQIAFQTFSVQSEVNNER